jgi:hypothetical protein
MRTTTRVFIVGLALLGLACGDTAPRTLAGTWTATTLTITPTGQPTTDVLAAGGTLNIIVAADMTTTGTLNIPSNVIGGPFNASMAGTATVNGNTVTFAQTADSFVRDQSWSYDGSHLSTTRNSNGVIAVVLTRQ